MINSKLKKLEASILQQTKTYKNKNIIKPYVLESFKTASDFSCGGGSLSTDSVNFKTGTYSLGVTTTVANSNSQILKTVAWNLSTATNFELKFYVADKTNLSMVAVYFGTATGQAFSFRASFVNGWNTLRFAKSQFTLNNMTWNDAITQFYVQVYSTAGGSITISLDSFRKNVKDPSNVLFCFDDGFASAYTIGIPYLESKGCKGNLAIYQSALNTAGYITPTQMVSMYNRGHDVINHSTNHPNNLGTYTYTNCAKEIQDMRDYLISMGITRGNDIFIYPSGYSTMAYQVAKDIGFVMARHSSGEINYSDNNLLNLQTRNIIPTSVIGDFTKFIDYVNATGGLLIIFVHDLQDTPTGINGSTALFKQIVDYAVTSKSNITTFSKYYESLFKKTL